MLEMEMNNQTWQELLMLACVTLYNGVIAITRVAVPNYQNYQPFSESDSDNGSSLNSEQC